MNLASWVSVHETKGIVVALQMSKNTIRNLLRGEQRKSKSS